MRIKALVAPEQPTATSTVAAATPTATVAATALPPTGADGDGLGGSPPAWLIAALAGVGFATGAGWAALRASRR